MAPCWSRVALPGPYLTPLRFTLAGFMFDILIEHGILVSPDTIAPIEHEGWLGIEEGRIVAVGEGRAPQLLREQAASLINARNMAVLPGIVNGHTHLSQTLMRGLADGRPLMRWLREVIWPLQGAMTPEEMYLAARLGLAENLLCGATAVVQHHKLPSRAHVAAAAQAASELGARFVLARGWVDLGPAAEPLSQITADLEWLHDSWHGTADGRIHVASGPLAAWRCSDEGIRETTQLARSWGAPIHIHIAESPDEVEMQLARCGRRPIEWLAELGALGPDVQLVHAVHVTDTELDLIAESGAIVVHCPTSNMYLASGAAPVRRMLDRGITVALGTDGSGSNNSQDMLECAKIAALLAKHTTGDAQALLPADVLRMLTVAGKRLVSSQGAGQMGLEPGAIADITIVDMNNPRCQPVHSAASALVYNASGADIHTVLVAGRGLVREGRLVELDEEDLLDESRSATAALMKRAGLA
jgi:5-methylthioadenosine/S-adenosylhomocysteine deaminase